MTSEYDLVVLGGGPGGYPCAIRAAQLGLKTALVEDDRLGGECLNYGCIPSKAMIGVSNLYEKVSKGERFGLEASGLKIDFAKLLKWKKSVVDSFVSGVELLCKGNGVEVIKGRGRIEDRSTISVTDGGTVKKVNYKKLVVATGSYPAELPDVKFDGKQVISSREALELDNVPESMLVIGGGAIGLEIATMYAKFNTKVTVVEVMDQLLPGLDADIVRVVHRGLERRGVQVHLGSRVTKIEKDSNSVTADIVTPSGQIRLVAQLVLMSVGRKPRSQEIGLEKVGVQTDPKGYIVTDRRMMTNVDGIYAIGDVRGPPLLAHKATKEGIVAAESAAGLPTQADWKTVPDAVFTDPEIATAGMTERRAVEANIKTKVTRFSFSALGRAMAVGETDGFVKLVSDQENGLILGVQIVGYQASDLISEAALAIEMGATVEDVALTIHPHPTMPEGIMEAAESAAGHPIHQLRLKLK
jgi:dihydrolipoamide dehydrogenase